MYGVLCVTIIQALLTSGVILMTVAVAVVTYDGTCIKARDSMPCVMCVVTKRNAGAVAYSWLSAWPVAYLYVAMSALINVWLAYGRYGKTMRRRGSSQHLTAIVVLFVVRRRDHYLSNIKPTLIVIDIAH